MLFCSTKISYNLFSVVYKKILLVNIGLDMIVAVR